MKKIKVLIILPSYAVGGAEKVMLSFFKNYQDSLISLKLLVINSKIYPAKFKNKDIINLNYSRFFYAIPSIIRILRKENYNIIFSTFPHISALLLVLKFIKIINNKILIRQPNIIEKSLTGNIKLFLLRNLYKYFIKYANAVIVTSFYMKDEALKNKVQNNKLFIIRNPIDIKKTRKNVKPKRISKENIELVFVGRLVFQKGIDRILHFFVENSNLQLTIIGDGELRKKLLLKTKNLGLLNRVKFMGQQMNPYNFIAGADYFILPSRWEGLPNCVLESLALGTPVIATKEVYSLLDFKKNISDKSILLFESLEELAKKIGSLKRRSDYKKPKIRKTLLIDYNSTQSYKKKVNNIIFKIG